MARARFTGDPAIFADLGPYELRSGDVVELPEGLEDSFLRRPDFEETDDAASELALPVGSVLEQGEPDLVPMPNEGVAGDLDAQLLAQGAQGEGEPEPEPEQGEPEPEASKARGRTKKADQGDDVTEEASAGN